VAAKKKKAKAKAKPKAKKKATSGGLAKKVTKLNSRVTHIEHYLAKASTA
jgi:hypothetical protein